MSHVRSVKKPFIVFGKPDIGEDEIEAVVEVMRSGWLGTGRVTKEFEAEFQKFMGGGYAIAVSSATVGLQIALKSLGIGMGQKVLTTPLTFCATINAIINVGALPLFSEVNKDGLLDKEKIKQRYLIGNIWHDYDAIVPVNYLGKSANFQEDSRYKDIPIIEDAAQSFGGSCGYGDTTVFSFYATKNITSGEGGMIWTKDKETADKCRILSNHGQSNGAWSRYSSGPINNYHVAYPGVKGNLPDILSAIGLAQLRRWPELKKKRDLVWNIYEETFGHRGGSRHLFTIQVKDRQKVREALYNEGIGTGIHYEALHLQPAYKYLGYKKGDFPMAEKIGEETLSLPVSNSMTEDDALRVVKTIKEVTNV